MQKTVNRFHGCKLITPLRPAVSVEYGAVLFGLTQASFASRVARYTYGIGIDVKLCPTNAKHSNPPNGAYAVMVIRNAPTNSRMRIVV
jgi:hypothetical protein